MMFNTDRTKPLCNNKAQKDMAVVNKQRYKSSTEQQMCTNSKFMHVNNINVTMFVWFFWGRWGGGEGRRWGLSDKHRLLGLCIKYIRLVVRTGANLIFQ